ncbi:hypothetical protein V6N13_026960 [Hibiscus sabdariffa]|uniref:Uncharacterized protein n=1 Tax=Hibiscus sabdariffa TaxID=183260 RepID=A0ABR2B362_9ROSI
MKENFLNKPIDDDLTLKELRVLACDANFDSLVYLCAALLNCKCKVEHAKNAGEAVEKLNANKHGFDVVFVDVDTDSSDAFKLLETIGHGMQLPVIMVTGDSSPENKTKGFSHGALDCIKKCPKEEEIMNTIRHHLTHNKTRDHQNQKPLRDSDSRTQVQDQDARSDKDGHSRNGKKKRMVWTPELEEKFVNIVQKLDKKNMAHPNRILNMMNEPGLTRDHVASHLQKYRMTLKKRKAAEMNEQGFQLEATSCRRNLEFDNLNNADRRLAVPSFNDVPSFSDVNSSFGPTIGNTLMPSSGSSPVPNVSFQSRGPEFETSDVYDSYLLETNVESKTTSQPAPYLHGEGPAPETNVPISRWLYITPYIYLLPEENAAFQHPGAVSSVPNHLSGITNNVQYSDSTVLAVNGVTEPVWTGSTNCVADNNQLINYSLPEETFDWGSVLNGDYFSG